MRDLNKEPEYWADYLTARQEFLGKVSARIKTAPQTYEIQVKLTAPQEAFSFNLVSAAYSSGASISDCVARGRLLLIESYPAYVTACALSPKRAHKDEAGGYDFRTRYLALAVLCNLTPDESLPLVEALDFWPDRDALWEKFIAYLGHGAGREPVSTLVWPDAYGPALEMFKDDATALTRQGALIRFDDSWLKEMRGSGKPFYSNVNNKNNTYVGYWNFEAAALAVMLDIDDSVLMKSKTYPMDWADWRRGQRPRQ